jgi:hypothetical protein
MHGESTEISGRGAGDERWGDDRTISNPSLLLFHTAKILEFPVPHHSSPVPLARRRHLQFEELQFPDALATFAHRAESTKNTGQLTLGRSPVLIDQSTNRPIDTYQTANFQNFRSLL